MDWTIVWATLGVTALLVLVIMVAAVVDVASNRKKRKTYGIQLGQGRE